MTLGLGSPLSNDPGDQDHSHGRHHEEVHPSEGLYTYSLAKPGTLVEEQPLHPPDEHTKDDGSDSRQGSDRDCQ